MYFRSADIHGLYWRALRTQCAVGPRSFNITKCIDLMFICLLYSLRMNILSCIENDMADVLTMKRKSELIFTSAQFFTSTSALQCFQSQFYL